MKDVLAHGSAAESGMRFSDERERHSAVLLEGVEACPLIQPSF